MSLPPARAKKVAIVGGGLAGLATAVALADRGLTVELFEARRQLGGRTGAYRDPATGALVDHCQHVSLGCCTAFADFCDRTGLDSMLTTYRTLHFIGPRGEQFDLKATRWLPAPLHLLPSLLRMPYLSWRERLSIISAMRKLVRSTMDVNGEQQTISDWLKQHRQSSRAIELFWTPVIVSALSETLDRVAVGPVRKVFSDAFLAGRHAYEMSVPTVSLAEFYGGRLEQWFESHNISVRKSSPVQRIEGNSSGVTHLVLATGETVQADFIVVASAWRRVAELFNEPLKMCLPELNMIEQFQSASITAVHLWFDRAITTLPHAVLPGRTSQWIFNRGQHEFDGGSGAIGHHYQIVISASGELAKRPREEIIAEVYRELTSIWPAAGSAKLLQSRMITEEHAVFSPLPGSEKLRPAQHTSIPNLFLAGDWTATGWPATMESAVRSGYLAAAGVLAKLGIAADMPCAK